MKRPTFVVGLAVFTLAAAALSARATRTPEEDRKAAYEQLEGRSAGPAGTTGATGLASGGYGLKAPPPRTVPLMAAPPASTPPAAQRVPTAKAAPPTEPRARSPLDELADRGLSGILLSALLGLGVGGGFGLLTGRKK